MAESSQIPASDSCTRRTCPDCGKEFEVSNALGSVSNCCDACHLKRMDFTLTSNPEVAAPPAAPPRWHRSRRVWIAAVICIGVMTAGVVWRKTIHSQYLAWSRELHAQRAVESFTKGDYPRTIIDGRSALELDPFDVETNRIIARACEAMGSPDVVAWRARLNVIRPGDVENALAWARAALKAGDIEVANDAILALKPDDRNSPDYHDIVAEIAMARRELDKAESHWLQATKLAPGREDWRLKLAAIQIKTRSSDIRKNAAETLATLSGTPAHQVTALRRLIEDAMNHQEYARARELADRLVASPEAKFIDKIGRLAVLRGADAPDSPSYLEELRDSSLTDAEQMNTLLIWMNQNGLPLLVSDWAPKLPPALVAKPPVCIAIAEALVKGREWDKLRTLAGTGPWKDFEHLRLAYQARVLESSENVIAAKATWERALIETENKAGRLAGLARLAQTWHWDERAEFALRKLSADENTPLWVLDALWTMSRKGDNGEDLHKISRLIVKARPKNPVARNNFIWLSLLRHSDEGAIHRLAEELHEEYPDDITIATTHALSMFTQGKVFEAINLLATFPPERLREPGVAHFYGIFLYAAGNTEQATEYLALTDGIPLLREEEELVSRMKRDSRLNTLVPSRKAATKPLPK